MHLHPYLAATDCAFTRLVRANYWLVADLDHRHARYWRDQVEACEAAFVAQSVGSASMPADVRERRLRLVRDQVGVAMRTGFEAASKRWHKGGTDVAH
ncbi:hypothetical protein [Thauera linaloolentis]|uniref:Uncharacterized protein n=1 Tax=Thauera linaloolentis (strain DSM 12138 / JCM 21573 / CCUG 41526 / CIP 105981 / IAM 15112 / NBRC 102519 / 47Lol) TaxID=1123367 RepID=N6XY17_THAL4|nr:hypothetical protein [Thauera linaloolentis]ENO86706.1 hypothetical protein C666_12655 [Thauera linaloolentis 47Lol = DSM 12138]MCM8566189.1 hypothetical protein [Thauera linaloolentis]